MLCTCSSVPLIEINGTTCLFKEEIGCIRLILNNNPPGIKHGEDQVETLSLQIKAKLHSPKREKC